MRKRFTKWYVRKGYTFGYDFSSVPIYGDNFLSIPGGVPESRFCCPWYVKPLLIFFSPSIYMMETMGRAAIEGFKQGLEEGD